LPPIDDEISTLDIAKAVQLFQEGCCKGMASDPETIGIIEDGCKTLLRSGLLREGMSAWPSASIAGRKQEKNHGAS